MIIAAFVVGLIIGLIVLINFLNSRSCDDLDTGVFLGAVLMIFCAIKICIVSNIIAEPKPKAIDVYQGKTTLEYTIRDGEIIDSVVVFKNSVYGK